MNTENVIVPRVMLEKFVNPTWGGKQLGKIFVFRNFTEEELIELYKRGEVRTIKPQAHAVIEGEPTRGLFVILHGSVSVHKNDPSTGKTFRIASLEEGATFGELSLFDNAPRSATVASETHCYLFYLDASNFEGFLEESGDNLKTRFYKACAENLSERFRSINSDYIISQQLLWKFALRRKEDEEEKKEKKKPRFKAVS